MSAPEKKEGAVEPQKDNRDTGISVMINPVDVVGVELEPVYISLGINQALFRAEVGGVTDK